jgi:tryptophanyl-tRNA synthetase
MKCAARISEVLAPIIEKRKYYENNIDEVKDILRDGESKGRKVAEETMNQVRNNMKLG